MVDREKVGAPLKKAFSAVLLLLWGITACVLTFDGPFNATGNGYFGTWASLFFATAFAWQELVGVRRTRWLARTPARDHTRPTLRAPDPAPTRAPPAASWPRDRLPACACAGRGADGHHPQVVRLRSDR